jgi:hypothetical protein
LGGATAKANHPAIPAKITETIAARFAAVADDLPATTAMSS